MTAPAPQSRPLPWWVKPALVVVVLGALVDLWARDWRLFAVGVVLLIVSSAVALRARQGNRTAGT